MPKKIVYVLGAGFSCPAKIPIQSQLLKEILSYKPAFDEAEVELAQKSLVIFLNDLFGSSNKVTLEDIFTILDRCVVGKERFKNYRWQELYGRREQLVYLILYIINKKIDLIPYDVKNIYENFSKEIIRSRRQRGKQKDPISIISSNWDNVLEIFIKKSLTSRQKNDTFIDYCTYTHFLKKGGVPHINLKSLGNYNIKILKLHGSLNWLYCSNCGRLYIDEEKNIGIQDENCSFCNAAPLRNDLRLEPIIITPTLLKEFNNLHIKNIWQNAFMDLQEATEIIFIGYSLPYSDFEFKYILKKAISLNAKIRVILVDKDKDNGTKDRYESFFGGNVDFSFDGLQGLIRKN